MGRTRDLSNITEDIKEKFHARMSTIKNRNGKDLTEAEKIKKRWQAYTQKNFTKKIFMTQVSTMM